MEKVVNYLTLKLESIINLSETIGIIVGIFAIIYLLVSYKKSYSKVENIKNKLVGIFIIIFAVQIGLNYLGESLMHMTKQERIETEKQAVTEKNIIYLTDRMEELKTNIGKLFGADNRSNIIGSKKLPPKINTFNKIESK